jgi:CRP-like cAMP-binding protein
MTPPLSPARRLHPDRLRRLAFFREFTVQEIPDLLAIGSVQQYDRGELLATEDTRKQRRILYVVLRGELQYVKRIRAERAVVVTILRPGDVGGFLTFLNDDPSPVSVRSAARTVVFEIGRRELHTLSGDHPMLGIKLMRVLMAETARRLNAMLDRVAATSGWALDLERHLRALPLLSDELPRG